MDALCCSMPCSDAFVQYLVCPTCTRNEQQMRWSAHPVIVAVDAGTFYCIDQLYNACFLAVLLFIPCHLWLLFCIQHWEGVPEHIRAQSCLMDHVRPGTVSKAQTQAWVSLSLEQSECRPSEKLGRVKRASAWGKGCERAPFLHGIEFLGRLQFLRQFGPYWHDDVTQLLQIYWLQLFIIYIVVWVFQTKSFEGYIARSLLQLKLYFSVVDLKNLTIPRINLIFLINYS